MGQGTEPGLRIPQQLYDQVVAYCQTAWPHEEACGYLAANADGTVSKVYPMRNVERSPIGYSMDPNEQFRVEKEIRANNLKLVGIYHSHTATEASPSTVDTAHAISPDVSYVIVSLEDREHSVVKSYRIEGQRVTEEPVRIYTEG